MQREDFDFESWIEFVFCFFFNRFIGDGFYVVRTRYGTACREKEVGRQGRPYSKLTADNFKLKLEFL